ncbi:MAG: D-alanyl-D-alanine carboxypeptidase [Candidatus Kerfeldbacteria bacterium]|nr:D-alanyl-D-alanine carboxypeptidase [Candidatus Kerfeldbacteria bacterium]
MIVPLLIAVVLFAAVPGAIVHEPPALVPVVDAQEQVLLSAAARLPRIPNRYPTPVKVDDSLGISVTADAAMVMDARTGIVLTQKSPDAVLPLASITKLMTALVFLDHAQGWDTQVTMQPDDDEIGGRLFVTSGEVVTARDLFFTGLVGSANNAMNALVRATTLDRAGFLAAMNAKAASMGMTATHFEDVTGLSPQNVSTARDVLALARSAFAVPEIREATTMPAYDFRTVDQEIFHHIRNTDELVGGSLPLGGGKTGFTDEAGYSLVVSVEPPDRAPLLVVVLSSASSSARFRETQNLATWTYDSHTWEMQDGE